VVDVSTIDDQSTAPLLDGRYRLEECVGRGGTAVVYRADDTALGRTVAIKLLRGPEAMPESMERAHGESAVLASMNHPSLVTLYDARLDPGHPQYLVMEYVHGPTLASRLAHGPLAPEETARLACEIASGLRAVHEAGIIHRDVKPSNILMSASTRTDREWTAKLTDFGIAFGMDDARLTSPGIAVGTAAYMAPEQVRVDELTPAVDVYSLGLVLIEAFTGEPAFPVAGGVQTALRRLTGPPTLPESLDAGWRELLEKMTRTEPGERPTAQQVAETAAALAPSTTGIIAAGGSMSADGGSGADGDRTPTRAYPVEEMATSSSGLRKRRIAAAGAAAAVIASIIALAGAQSLWSSTEEPKQNVVIETPTPTPTPTAPASVSTAGNGSRTTGDTAPSGGAANSNPNSSPNKGPGANSGSGPDTNSGNKDHPPKGKKK
jgi:serine/threonine protein kinase